MKAFTLIELMVTISIILILSGTSVAAYLNFSKSQSMDSDARQVVSELSRIRSLSENLVYPTGCSSLLGYNVKSVDVGSLRSGIVTTVVCSPASIVGATQKLLSSTYFSAPFDITFMPITGHLQSATDTEISIVNAIDSTTDKTISVGALGLISIKPEAAAPTPTATPTVTPTATQTITPTISITITPIPSQGVGGVGGDPGDIPGPTGNPNM